MLFREYFYCVVTWVKVSLSCMIWFPAQCLCYFAGRNEGKSNLLHPQAGNKFSSFHEGSVK